MSTALRRIARWLPVAAAALWASGCEREERRLREPAAAVQRSAGPVNTELRPGMNPDGGAVTGGSRAVPQALQARDRGPYGRNAYGISEGAKLYVAFNCVGCHANGGGGMGPPLMDASWIYGSDPESVFSSIVEGRQNGMPSFRGKIPDYQVWQLVAYVRSMSGNVAYDAIPGRTDHMAAKKSGALTPEVPPQEAPK